MRERLLASTMIVGAFAVATAGQAAAQAVQTAPEAGPAPAAPTGGAETTPSTSANGAPAAVKEVVVTGSRIPQPGLTSASPLTVVNDQEIKLEGTTNVESLINNLPQAVAEQTSQVSNGATGTATADLRGLGSNRTLVLVDGKRLMPGDPTLPSPDLNNIPAQLVDRVEVTTGGASAIYGSDAIAGVVNFVMKHDFQGVRLDAQGGFSQTDNSGDPGGIREAIGKFNQTSASPISIPGAQVDGRTIDVTAIVGANTPDDKGNVTAYVEYRNMQAITQNNRLGSACGLSTIPSGKTNAAGNIYDTHVCQGSSNSAFGHFKVASLTNGNTTVSNPAGLAALGVNTGTLSNSPTTPGAFIPYSGALSYNFGPLNYFQRPDDRYTAGFFSHYAVNKMFDLYSDFMFEDDHTVAQIAPSGLFQGTAANGGSTFAVNCNNPLMSASQAQALCGSLAGSPTAMANLVAGLRFANGDAPRQDDLRHTEYKIDIGSRGEIAPGWNYDAYLQYGTAILSERYLNDVSTDKTQAALLTTDGVTCAGGQAGCSPLNIFSAAGPSAAALKYLLTPGFQEGQTTEQVADASITGDLGQYGITSPLATDGVGLAMGTEYRRENLVFNTDEEFTSGDLAGQGGPRIGNSGSFDVYELFGEIRVPVVQDKPFVKNLSFDGAYRFSQYSTAGRTDTYEAQFTYNVNRDIGFRGGYSRAVRAPNVNELFAAQSVGLFSGTDPCAGTNPSASAAACARTGVSSAAYGTGQISQCPAGQCSELAGGNPNLQPEKADTFTLGAVFTPTESFLRGFTLTVDWFDIDVKNIVTAGVGGANVTLTQCLATGAPVYCNLIHRDPTTGDVFGQTGYVIATNTNTGFLRTEGVDVEANYRTRFTDWGLPDYGSLSFNMDGTYTYESITQPVSGGGDYNCAGLYGSDKCGTPLPRWRHKARLTWTPPYPFTVSLQWRFYDSVRFDGNSANPFLSEGVLNAADAVIPVQQYLDVAFTYRIKDNLTARFGINNVLDSNAPVVDANVFPASGPATGNGNTFPGVYDALGRDFFFGITADF